MRNSEFKKALEVFSLMIDSKMDSNEVVNFYLNCNINLTNYSENMEAEK